jgi:hypothetical protein
MKYVRESVVALTWVLSEILAHKAEQLWDVAVTR